MYKLNLNKQVVKKCNLYTWVIFRLQFVAYDTLQKVPPEQINEWLTTIHLIAPKNYNPFKQSQKYTPRVLKLDINTIQN